MCRLRAVFVPARRASPSDGGVTCRRAGTEQRPVEVAHQSLPVAVAEHLDERAPNRVGRGAVASPPSASVTSSACRRSLRDGSSSSRIAVRSGHVAPSSAPSAERSCSARKGSCWKSESSQRSSASASGVSASARPRRASSSAASGPRNESRRVGSPGGCVAAIGSTGRMPYGRPSSVSNSTGPAASGAAVASRSAETASANSAGASGGSSSAASALLSSTTQ